MNGDFSGHGHRIRNLAISNGSYLIAVGTMPTDRRTPALRAQLDDLLLCMAGQPHRLATPQEALDVQRLVEELLRGKS
ncbi:hypothetical protein GALL_438250 [mine drainage metagenome]|uniref:Uncharacterized protein n=1 Tax=mine drainage metagenome TaxID=410659 RepID=A0A1J5QAJ8_9ZZZZ